MNQSNQATELLGKEYKVTVHKSQGEEFPTITKIAEYPDTMSGHRALHPKPLLFDLIHKWNLPLEQSATLAFYKLQSIPASELDHWIRRDSGLLIRAQQNMAFVPVYQHVSRRQIEHDAKCHPTDRYYLSFRATDTTATVLIQRAEPHNWIHCTRK